MIWSGLGRWIGKEWKPYLESDNHEIDLEPYKDKGRHNFGTLCICGDSTNGMFADEYFERKGLCDVIWKRYVLV